MIICFLKYYSVRKAQEAKDAKDAAVVSREASESRPRDASIQTDVLVHELPLSGATISESLG